MAVDEGQGLREIENFYLPYSRPTGPAGMNGELVYVGAGDADALRGKDLKGKIALVDLPAVNISWTQFNIFGNIGHDPGQTGRAGAAHSPSVGGSAWWRSIRRWKRPVRPASSG